MKTALFRLRSAGALTLALVALRVAPASAQVYNPQRVIYQVDARTIAATGGIATLTLTPTRSYVAITCNDTDGCAVTMGESGIPDGMPVTIVNMSTNFVTLTPSSGVLEAPCPMQLQQYESFNLIYRTDRWVAVGANLTCRTITTLTDTQIKALPTTAITIVAAPGSGYRIRPVAVSLSFNTSAGAYTNLDAVYVDMHLTLGTDYVMYGPIDDSTSSPALTNITSLLGSAAARVQDVSIPPLASTSGAGLQYVQQVNFYVTAQQTNTALQIGLDNNGTGNLTAVADTSANTLKVTVYWFREAT